MKIKNYIIVFNILIILLSVIIISLPFFFLEKEEAINFFSQNKVACASLFIIELMSLGIVNYFLSKISQISSLLEKKEYQQVHYILKNKFNKGNLYNLSLFSLFINLSFITSDLQSLKQVSKYLIHKRRISKKTLDLIFNANTGYFLTQNFEELEQDFKELNKNDLARNHEWIQFQRIFNTYLAQGELDFELLQNLKKSHNMYIQMFSLFFLSKRPDKHIQEYEADKTEFIRQYSYKFLVDDFNREKDVKSFFVIIESFFKDVLNTFYSTV